MSRPGNRKLGPGCRIKPAARTMAPAGMAFLLALAIVVTGCGAEASTEPVIRFHFTHFQPDYLTVMARTPVTFTLQNDDPIEHEWIVGTEEVHERHRTGTEPYHDEIPTEVTVPALSSRVTTVTFDQPGEYQFMCHLPGHEAYGMKGTLKVVGR